MIAERFYTSELKSIIADLNLKNDLNYEAVHNLNQVIIKSALLFFFIIVLMWVIFTWYVSLLLLVLTPVFMAFDTRNYINNRVMPYVSGQRRELILKKIIPHYIENELLFESASGERFITPRLIEFKKIIQKEHIGKKMGVFFMTPKKSMPDLLYLKKKYCLSRNLTEENNHA